MAVSWVPPLGAVANVVATATSGGSVTEDTYYIRICGANFESYTATGSTGKFLRGAPSEEVDVTVTTGNQTIEISWDALTGASYYNVYVTSAASGDTRWYKTHIDRESDGVANRATTSSTSITLTSDTYLDGAGGDFDSFAYRTDYFWDGNIDRELGFGYLLIEDSVGDLTIQDLVDVLDTASAQDYYYWDGNYFVLKGGITIENGASGSLAIDGETFLLSQNGMVSLEDTDFSVTFDNAVILVDAYSDRFARYLYNSTMTSCAIKQVANSYSYAYMKAGDVRICFRTEYLGDGGGNIVIGNVYPYLLVDKGDVTMSRLSSQATNNYAAGGTNIGEFADCYIPGAWALTEATSSGHYQMRRTLIGVFVDYNVRFRNALTAPAKAIDCDFITLSGGQVTDNTRPIIYWSDAASYDAILDIYFSFNVLTEPEATVSLYNASGTEVFSEDVDGDGVLSEQEVLVTRCTHKSGSGSGKGASYTDFTDYGDFTLIIRKSGYKTYEKVITIDEKIDWRIKLERNRFIK